MHAHFFSPNHHTSPNSDKEKTHFNCIQGANNDHAIKHQQTATTIHVTIVKQPRTENIANKKLKYSQQSPQMQIAHN